MSHADPDPAHAEASVASADTDSSPAAAVPGWLRVSGLGCHFGAARAVVDLNFELAGGVVVMLGQNGAGKSTTLRMLANLQRPSTGNIESAAPWGSIAYRRQLGYLPERLPLYPDCRVRDQLAFAARLFGLSQTPARVDDALERFQLTEVARRRIGHLSKGFQQRVGLAQATIHRPAILLLDEPASGLDPVQQQQLQDQISHYAQDALVLLSTHNLNEAITIADRLLVMHQGRQIWFGSAGSIDKSTLVDLLSGDQSPVQSGEQPSEQLSPQHGQPHD